MKLCHFEAGGQQPLFLIAGPCVIEGEALAIETAGKLKEICLKISETLNSKIDSIITDSNTDCRKFITHLGI